MAPTANLQLCNICIAQECVLPVVSNNNNNIIIILLLIIILLTFVLWVVRARRTGPIRQSCPHQ